MEEIRRFRILGYSQEQVNFLTFEEMEGALREIHNGRDIYLILGEKVIYLAYTDVGARLSDGRLQFTAKVSGE